jgi:hypothetical protein
VDQFRRHCLEPLGSSLRETELEGDALAVDIAVLPQPLPETLEARCRGRHCEREDSDPRDLGRLLSVGCGHGHEDDKNGSGDLLHQHVLVCQK